VKKLALHAEELYDYKLIPPAWVCPNGSLMVNLLYSYYKPICLTLVVLLGLACGHLVDSVLQFKLHPAATGDAASAPVTTASTKNAAEPDLDLVLQNNIFDAGSRSETARMNLAADTAGVGGGDGTPVSATRADLRLIGTVVAGEESLALLENDREMNLYRLGAEVPGGGVLEEIQRTEVTIRNRDQSRSTLVLHEPDTAASANRPSLVPDNRGASSARSRLSRVASGGVREVGENRWVISQNVVDTVRENFAAQLRLAQMQPRLVDGKTDGFLVQRIYPQSILAQMGLQRGDVVIDVNNIRLDSPEKALQIFQQLREARRVTVSVERNGQPQSFVYEIE
jgi:general secretion pathway protein C